ncbi:MAG: DNA repair protein RadA [Desulfuromonadales bacterium]|nr:MAG: DNA repair protein RadA [Desulfuromonadales bacterium]
MKHTTLYVCQSCGYQSAKWLGRCPDCAAWNSLVEEVRSRSKGTVAASHAGSAPVSICDVACEAEARLSCGISEFDRVLGGGLVAGSVILIGGDPGIGKSTLLLQVMEHLAQTAGPALYVSGEESARQTRLRGERLGIRAKELLILAETGLEAILAQIDAVRPRAVVIDSIQTMYAAGLESAPGSVSQVRESAGRLIVAAKRSSIPIFIVGHVTKDGSLAGPRVLEHMVDTVLSFEGDRGHAFRILRAVKNRFGSTNEIGVFEMKEGGLCEVRNPSELFLSERPLGVSGSAVVTTIEGSRPLLVELQALVTPSSLGVPRRTTLGVDANRLALLVAVLDKKVGLHMAGQDIFLNAAGGARVGEPAADLGMVAALASSHLDKAIAPQTVIIGEVGLAGEVRAITQPEIRVREAAKLGFTRAIIPAGSLKQVTKVKEMDIVGVTSVAEALEQLL